MNITTGDTPSIVGGIQKSFDLYLDLDGTLVDFERKAIEIAGVLGSDDPADKLIRKKMWTAIAMWIKAGNKFFEHMEQLPDASVLWDYVKSHNPTILSATGHTYNAAAEKRAWVAKHLGPAVSLDAIFVVSAVNKAEHAKPGRILIDDRRKAIDPWVAAGGIGVLHTSAADTISQLRKLGIH